MKKAWSQAKIEALDIENTQGAGGNLYAPTGNGKGHGNSNGCGHGINCTIPGHIKHGCGGTDIMEPIVGTDPSFSQDKIEIQVTVQ